jgi:DNA polymerase-3 subunit alpha
MEKDLVGLYLSGHPLENMRGALERSCSANASTFKELDNDQECTVGGIISDVRFKITRRNDKMAFVKIEDLYGSIPITFFPRNLKNCEAQLAVDRIVVIKGKATHRERLTDDENASVEVEILGESVSPLKSGTVKPNGNGRRCVHIRINGHPSINLDFLKSLLENNPGESPVFFWMEHDGTRRKVATPYRVEPTSRFVVEVQRVVGDSSIKVA